MNKNALNIIGRISLVVVAAFLLFATGCSDDKDTPVSARYGYVQFKLFKRASYNKSSMAANNELEYLAEAGKMRIVLMSNEDGSEISQTVTLNPMGNDAELGLRSEKIELLAGSYNVVGYYLYKVVGQELVLILGGSPAETVTIDVAEGGLAVTDLTVNVVERGKVKFSLSKNMVQNKSVDNADNFNFKNVAFATVTVENQFTKVKTVFQKIPVKYKVVLDDSGFSNAIAVSDTALVLEAGTFKAYSYELYDKSKRLLEADKVLANPSFQVADNKVSDVDVAVNIYYSAAYIQDYIALRKIWEALDGPNWSYDDLQYPLGTNWNFDKDIDLWGVQPGIDIDSQGRITILNMGSFGPRGRVPDEIGLLTELKVLTLGTHSDRIGGNMPEQWGAKVTTTHKDEWRNDYYNRFIKKDIRSSFSEPLQKGFELKGKPVEHAAMSSGTTRDAGVGVLTNGITGISKEISKLVKLQQLFIANGKFTDFEAGTDFSKLENLTDVELYNCPSMKQFPSALATAPNIELLNLADNPQISGADFVAGLDNFAKAPVGGKLQILYLRNNMLETLPASFKNLKKLGKLDCGNNQLKTIPAFGKDINLVQLNMEFNQIEVIPEDFCGFEDVESFVFSNNKLTKFPNLFDANTIYGMTSVDFSNNQITEFEGGDNFKGIYVQTLSLGGNRLKKFPGILFNKNSRIGSLLLAGNGIEEFPEGSLDGKYTYMLESLDLTFNKLTKLPKDFNAVTLPYLYGIDMSHNRFSSFPLQPLNIASLVVFGLRNQADADGTRIMREWPTGISTVPSLRALYLGGNDLRKIDDTISPNIRIFEIKDNPNISIDVSGVCAYIRAGLYTLIYDPSQDIRGCDYLTLD
jgi:Leucine-rich repeat (LRR) protein